MGDGDLAMWLFRNLEEAATEEEFHEKWTCFTKNAKLQKRLTFCAT